MNVSQIEVEVVNGDNLKKYLPLFNLISRVNKNFNSSRFTTIAIVNNNSIDVGLIGITYKDKEVFVELFQAPKVCRLSIISIIESSLALIKTFDQDISNVIYSDLSMVYSFKITSIFKEVIPDETGALVVPYKLVSDLDLSNITSKNIIII